MALIQVNFTSSILMRDVPMTVILPIDKLDGAFLHGKEKTAFKTLYLLHGFTDNCMQWLCNTRIRQWAEEKNLAVIMPSGDNSFYIDQLTPNNDYGEFVGRELVQITRKMFPLSCRREDTFIAGQSMGGFGALRNGFKYADTFGYIAALSSALHIFEEPFPDTEKELYGALRVFGNLEEASKTDKNPKVILKDLKQAGKQIPKIYMSCGLQDGLLASNRSMRDFLVEKGVDFVYEEVEGGHCWEVWDKEMQKILKWLPLDEVEKGFTIEKSLTVQEKDT
ncbi:MAG: alpha/beta hydrolase [Dorea sp.]